MQKWLAGGEPGRQFRLRIVLKYPVAGPFENLLRGGSQVFSFLLMDPQTRLQKDY